MNKFKDFYQIIKPQIEKELIKFNNNILKEKNELILENLKVFANLNDKGKMIRGTLIALGYSFKNTDISKSIYLACAYEVFETSILVHDDIIDNDNLRRGVATLSYYNKDKYKDFLDNKEYGDAIALCIGDYGLFESIGIIVDNYSDNNNLGLLIKTYKEIVIDTIRGEILDVASPFLEKNNIEIANILENVWQIYKLKTAHYTLVGPLKLGMILGGNSQNEINDIIEFATPLGIAFQIQDDILAIYSEANKIGKMVGNDIKEFKQTILYAYTKGTNYYDSLMEQYGKNDFDLIKVQNIFIDSKALRYAEEKMDELYKMSLQKLDKMSWLDKKHKEILKDLVFYLKARNK